ncbi:MAG: adenosylcobinamide-GDP ribazoletransferase [Hyphomicrobiales bacterium]
MADDLWFQRRINELTIGFVFLTRLPLPLHRPLADNDLSRALWSAPVVGAAVGLIGAIVYGLTQALHLPPLPAAALVIAATVLVTGALHEDGLADVADGFGGGAARERKLEIMRDSRIGTYGVCALILSFMLRVAALTNLGDPGLVGAALVAAHAAARAPMAAFMWLVPTARSDGLSATAGTPPQTSAVVAALLGAVALLIGLGLGGGVVAVILLCGVFAFMAWLCKRQIGGQTGDVLGALEQVGEIVVLLVAAAAVNTLR